MTFRNTLLIIFFLAPLFTFSQINFVDEAISLGLNFTCGTTYIGNGVSFYDYDKDGWDDLSFATEDGQNISFYKNNNGSFVLDDLNIPNLNYQTRQINWVDFDNDGDQDLYITSDANGNKLLENDGSLNFTDITSTSGLPTTNIFTYGASWGDYDNDSYLDVFICSFDSTKTIPNYLYKNNGDGTFTNVSSTAGISSSGHLSFCSAFFDYNNDGWQDIYISNDRSQNLNILYKNNGDGTFTDASAESGTNIALDAMTVTIGDYNSDGWFDIYVTNSPKDNGNAFLKNNGDGTFTDIASTTGTQQYGVCWGAVFLDAENDNDLDLYVSSSASGSVGQPETSIFYENLGSNNFTIPSAGFLSDTRQSHSNAVGDVDNDGLLDIVVTNNGDGIVNFWKNNSTTSNNWLKVNLTGTDSNKDGVGSVIEISVNGNKQYRYTLIGEGYLSQNSSSEIFGLGANTSVEYVKVTWLSGTEDVFNNISANQTLNIVEGSSSLSVYEYDFNGEYTFYPNPIKDIVAIKGNEFIKFISIYDVYGNTVREENGLNEKEKSINIEKFSSGIYFIKITSINNSKSILKIVKL